MIETGGLTNVTSIRMGGGAIQGIGKEAGRFVVSTMDIPWQITRDALGAAPEKVIMIESIEKDWLDEQISSMPPCDAIVGIGGGQAVDAGKYFAWRMNLPFISVPTILSVNAFVTPAAGIRVNHEVEYVGEVSPDPLIIDYDIVRTAPQELNIAGVGDLLSMHTASWDWRYAHSMGKSEFPFSQEPIDQGQEILEDLFGILTDIRNTTDVGLRAIVEGYMKLNTICLGVGHFRIEEGSEHYLFYELEERLKRPFIHGNIIGLGIYILSRLQGNKSEMITEAMEKCGLAYHPASMGLRKSDLTNSLLNLRSYVASRPKLWYTVINDSEISREWIDRTLADLRFES
jgi:glycerol-1-phosphate dehydrogenase [NAD(P)+]